MVYGIVGGTPQYLLQIDDKKSVEEDIKNTFLNSVSFLFEEPENLLKQEVREPALYNAIITAIANGASRMAEISTKVKEDTSVCVTTSTIMRGAADIVYKRMEPHLSDYMGKVFEEICRQYLWKLLLTGKSLVEFKELGRWWGTDASTRSQAEIDIMGEENQDTALFAECKWTNEKVDTGVLKKLTEKSRLFHYRNVHFYFFAKNGFTKGCIDRAEEMGNVTLVSYKDMMKVLG